MGNPYNMRRPLESSRPLKVCAWRLAVPFHPDSIPLTKRTRHTAGEKKPKSAQWPFAGREEHQYLCTRCNLHATSPQNPTTIPPKDMSTGVLPCKQARKKTETKTKAQRSSHVLGGKSWSRPLWFLDISRTWEPRRGLRRLFVQNEQGGLTFLYFLFFFGCLVIVLERLRLRREKVLSPSRPGARCVSRPVGRSLPPAGCPGPLQTRARIFSDLPPNSITSRRKMPSGKTDTRRAPYNQKINYYTFTFTQFWSTSLNRPRDRF